MNINLQNLLSIYTYRSERKSWTSKNQRSVSVVSYQVDGHYNHTFPFGVLEVKKDCVFTINPNDPYLVERLTEGSSICFTFTSETPISTELIDCSSDPRFLILFRKLLKYKNLSDESTYYKALSVAYEILALITEKRNAGYYQESKNKPFIELRDYLAENFGDSALNLKELSEKYGFSDKYFRDRFRELFGSTPTQYLIGLRLNEAARLLGGGTHTVSEVAEQVGFSDIYYFSRLFKKRFNSSPTGFKG